MSNFGLLSRSVRGGGKDFSNVIWKHSFEKDATFHIYPLTCPFIPQPTYEEEKEKGPIPVAFKTHFVMKSSSYLCDAIYSDNTGCEKCAEPNSFGEGNNYPSTGLTFVGYVLECIGVTKTSKKGNEYKENPEKVIEIPKGRKFINWAELREAYDEPLLDNKGKERKFKSKQEEDEARKERFLNTLFRIKKIDGGWSIKVIDPLKLGQQAATKVPEDLREKYDHLSLGAQIGVCASVYSNVKWKHPDIEGEGIVPPAEVAAQSEDDSSVTSSTGGNSEIDLNEDPLEEDED